MDVFEESGKTGFGFWLVVKPKGTRSVTLNYKLPAGSADGYRLFWQKQSGTGADNINFSFKLPEGKKVINQSAGVQTIGDNLALNSDLLVDRNIDITFR